MKIILAPMQGLTELLFRRAYCRCFPAMIDSAISPFLSLTHGNLADAKKKIGDVLPEANKDSIPVVPQILGNEPQEFIDLANHLFDIGYDETNWNIGCPMRKIAHKHRGSGILPYPNEVEKVLQTIIPQLKPQLSIKMRLGYYDTDEIESLIPVLNKFPLKRVILHPRIGKQQYSGHADLQAYLSVAQRIIHPMVYNGDIVQLPDFITVQEQIPNMTEVMIGRGVLYNPLLPIQIKCYCGDISEQQLQQAENNVRLLMKELLKDIETYMPTEQAMVRKCKEYWVLMHKAFMVSEEEKNQVLHCVDFESAKRSILEMI